MKTRMLKSETKLFAALTLVAALIFVSCEKEDENLNTNLNNTELSTDVIDEESYATELFDEVLEIGDEALAMSESTLKSTDNRMYSRLSECVTVTKTITDSIRTTVIDFGEENCLCNDGRERRGKIIMTHEGRFWDGLVYIDFAFENFFVDDNQIVGEKSVVQTINDDGNRESSININGSLIFADNAGTIAITAERVRTIIEGSDTRTKRDDIVALTGESTCNIFDTLEVSSVINEDLIRKNEPGCFMYFVSGVREINKTGESTLTINYGDGTCDNLADVTQNGVTTTIELKRKCNGRMNQ